MWHTPTKLSIILEIGLLFDIFFLNILFWVKPPKKRLKQKKKPMNSVKGYKQLLR